MNGRDRFTISPGLLLLLLLHIPPSRDDGPKHSLFRVAPPLSP